MDWALPEGVNKNNYEYAKRVLKLASTTGVCGYTMKTKTRSHEQYCRKFKKDKFLDNDFFKDEILKLENMIKEYEKENFVEVDESWKILFMRRLTLDKAIKHAKEVADMNYNDAEKFDSNDSVENYMKANCMKCAEQHEKLAEWLEELKSYKEAEEQGLLVRLPCKVGTEVYYILGIPNKMPCAIDKCVFRLSDVHKIGESLFLTREEAEKKLEEMKNAKNA